MASKLGYAILATITGPIGGAVSGYLYASKQNELAAAQGLPRAKSEFVSTLIGLIFEPISNIYYGWNLADTQNQLDAVRAASNVHSRPITSNALRVDSPELAIAQTKWRDTVDASRTQQTAQQR